MLQAEQSLEAQPQGSSMHILLPLLASIAYNLFS